MLSEENTSSQYSPQIVARQLSSQNFVQHATWSRGLYCMPSMFFFCYSDSSPVAFTSLARSCTISDIGGLNSGCRCIMKDSDQIRSDIWSLDPKHFVQIIRWNMPLWYCRLQWKDEEESKFELPGYSGWLCQQNVTILSQNIVHV